MLKTIGSPFTIKVTIRPNAAGQTQLDKNELIMTFNKDRKQTKYGHKRQEHMTHMTDD